MKYDPAIHHRRSIRLQGHDYSRAGAYFITLCIQHRGCLFGEIMDGEIRLNGAGEMIQTVWDEIPIHYPGIDIDEFVIMPNHIHGIVVITTPVGATPRGCPGSSTPPRGCPGSSTPPRGCPGSSTTPRGCPGSSTPPDGCPGSSTPPDGCPIPKSGQAPDIGQAQGPAPTQTRQNNYGGLSLPDVVHRFKTMTTKRYADGVKQNGWTAFPGRLWQRNYWEHIIRNESELNRIREYIHNNPAKWELDKLFVRANLVFTPNTICEPSPEYATEVWMV